jgi:hypothetical protein
MNILIDLQTGLAAAMLQDTALALANCAAWLDPVLLAESDTDLPYADYGEEDDLAYALQVCRDCFPDVYADVVQRLWLGDSQAQLSRILCAEVSRFLVAPLHNLEQVKYGVPFEALGLDPGDPDFPAQYPHLARVTQWFGADGFADEARDIAAVLIQDLARCGDQGNHADLARLLGWLSGSTGNTLVDRTDEMLWESGIEPPAWTPEDVQFINDVQTEANQVVAAALRALDLLENHPAWAEALQHNVRLVSERKANHARLVLEWPDNPGNGAPDSAEPDPELLPVRGDPAPPDR